MAESPGIHSATPAVAPPEPISPNSAAAAATRAIVRAAISAACSLVALDGEQRELVAAVARGDVVGAGPAAQRVADAAQHLVADQVAVLLVDLLEVVEVEEDQREVAAGHARGALDLAQQALVQRRVVEAAGQPVGARGLRDRGVEAGVAARGGGELGERLEQAEVVLADVVRARVADGDDAAQLARSTRTGSRARPGSRSNGEPAGSAAMLW